MKIVKIGAMWCPSCIVTNKFWPDIVEKYSNVEFQELDIDLDEEETNQYPSLDILPVIIVEKQGKEVKRLVGEHSKEEISNMIEEYSNEK